MTDSRWWVEHLERLTDAVYQYHKGNGNRRSLYESFIDALADPKWAASLPGALPYIPFERGEEGKG